MKRVASCTVLAVLVTMSLAAQPAGTVAWQKKLLGQPHLPPVAAPDGRIVMTYLRHEPPLYDVPHLLVLGVNGELRFDVRKPGGFGSLPVVAPNGAIYTVGQGRVDAIGADAKTAWSYVVAEAGRSDHHVTWTEIAVRPADSAAIVAGRCVHALAATGTRLWQACLGERSSAPRYEHDSVFVRSGGRFHRLDNNGKALWSVDVGAGQSAAAFDRRGTAYVASGKTVSAVAIASGTVTWQAQVPEEIDSLAWSDAAQLIALQRQRLDVIDRSGKPRWQLRGSDRFEVFSGPVAVVQTDFYVGGSAVRRFGPDGPIAGRWNTSRDFNMFAPVLTPDGRVLVMADVDNLVTAIPVPR